MSTRDLGRGQDLCLLCLDGGGVRGLSSLHIVKRLMESINPEDPPKPCDYFDMIGGTSTGGLIALMLGRLAMPVDEAIEAYIALAPKIFTKMHHRVTLKGQVQGRFDHAAIEEGVRELLDEKGYNRDELLKDSSGLGCKTFVCATSKHAAETVVLSTYPSRRRGLDLLNITKVWEAARATAAASSFFDPIRIGNVDFIDGATPANNPISEMWTEAFDVFKEGDNWRLEDNILCLVSIGTGIPAIRSFGDDPLKLGKALLAIATDTERRAEDFHRHHSHMAQNQQYFRFNVLRGLESIGLEEASKLDQINACTQKYLQSETVCSAVEACGKRLIERENLQPVIEIAKYTGRQAAEASDSMLESYYANIALNGDHPDLCWFTNTSLYQKWLRKDDDAKYIWYPITSKSRELCHESIASKVYQTLQGSFPNKGAHKKSQGIYLHFSNTSDPICTPARPGSLPGIFRSLVSQILITYSDMRAAILKLSKAYRSLLRQLYRTDLEIEKEDLVDLLLACLRLKDILDSTGEETAVQWFIVLEKAQEPTAVLASRKLEAWKLGEGEELTKPLKLQNASSLSTSMPCFLNFDAMFSRREQVTHAESGTNEWIWSYEPYVEWSNESSGILWIQGKPGSGKSVLAKTILGHLVSTSKDRLWHIADWFYNERGGERSTSHSSMLRALLFQILKQDHGLFRYYKDFYRSPEWLASLPEVLLCLAGIEEDPPSILCVIDAMDESRDTSGLYSPPGLDTSTGHLREILNLFLTIVNVPSSRIKVLVLSRPNRQIEKSLKHSHRIVLEYANTRDIEMIADAGLKVLRKSMTSFDSSDEEDPLPSINVRSCQASTNRAPHRFAINKRPNKSMSWKASQASRMFLKARKREEEELSSIRTYILKHAQGVILWVTLIMQDLIHHVQKGMFTFIELKELLLGLPLEIHGMYRRILYNIQKTNSYHDQVKARRIILWVMGASETKLLRLEELLDALAITWDVKTGLASAKDPVSSNRPQVRSWNHFQRSLQELCGPFLSVVRPSSQFSDQIFHDFDVDESFLVQLTHQTAKDFLASKDAENLRVTVSEAKLKVAEDKTAYLTVVLPENCTNYAPTMSCHQTPTNHEVQEMVCYLEDKFLLRYILSTLSLDLVLSHASLSCRPLLGSLERATAISQFLVRNHYPDMDVVDSAENSMVGQCFLFAIRSGMVVSIENMLFIASTQSWWSGFYKHHVKNAALLAAVEHGFALETKVLLASHPDRGFGHLNRSLLLRAFQTKHKWPEMFDHLRQKTPEFCPWDADTVSEKSKEAHGVREAVVEGSVQQEEKDISLNPLMERLQVENDSSGELEGANIEEVRRAIAVIIRYH
ncbi:hypothetical protein IFR05_016312 [Cadophora sp. M221]|nr:hypothetical protein IFR05_016312 [Cadophora sp. M221]